MHDVRQRLIRCFSSVFPDLDETGIQEATITSVEAWDSIATVTLLTLVEEEFGFPVDVDDVDQFVSFDSMLLYVTGKAMVMRAGQ